MLKLLLLPYRRLFGLITVQDNTMLKLASAIACLLCCLITVQDNTMLKQTI